MIIVSVGDRKDGYQIYIFLTPSIVLSVAIYLVW